MLKGRQSMSKPENLLMYLKSLKNVTMIGQPTRGTNGNVTEVELMGEFVLNNEGTDKEMINSGFFLVRR